MDFLFQGELLFVLGVVAGALLIGLLVAPYLKKTGKITEKDLEFTSKILAIVELIVRQMKFKDEKAKETSLVVVNITKLAVDYTYELMGDLSVEERRAAAIRASEEALVRLGIELTDEYKQLIRDTVYLFI